MSWTGFNPRHGTKDKPQSLANQVDTPRFRATFRASAALGFCVARNPARNPWYSMAIPVKYGKLSKSGCILSDHRSSALQTTCGDYTSLEIPIEFSATEPKVRGSNPLGCTRLTTILARDGTELFCITVLLPLLADTRKSRKTKDLCDSLKVG